MTASIKLLPALPTPATVGYATSTTGGTLPVATYFYRVSAIMAVGPGGPIPGVANSTGILETQASVEGAGQLTTGTTSTVTITITAVAGATHYGIYGRTTGAETLMAIIPASQLTFTDTGALTPIAGKTPLGASTALAGNSFLAGGNNGYIQVQGIASYTGGPAAPSPFTQGRQVTVVNMTGGAIVVTGSADGITFNTASVLTPAGVVVTTMPALSLTDIMLPNFLTAASAGLYVIASS